MTGPQITAWAVVSMALIAIGCALAGAWWARGRRTLRAASGLAVAVVAVLLGAALAADQAAPLGTDRWLHWLALGLSGIAAVLGGGAVTVAVLTVVDRRAGRVSNPAATAALRGGAWIGVLERIAIFAALTSGFPTAVAVILAIKGLARYPELRSGSQAGVAERFIIGTFTSLLAAAGAAGTAHLLLG